MAEDDGLSSSPVIVVDLGAIFCGDHCHVTTPSLIKRKKIAQLKGKERLGRHPCSITTRKNHIPKQRKLAQELEPPHNRRYCDGQTNRHHQWYCRNIVVGTGLEHICCGTDTGRSQQLSTGSQKLALR